MHADAFSSDTVYNNTEIDTPFFTTKGPGAPMTPDQAKFQTLTDEAMTTPRKTKMLIVRSRYGSGKTTCLQRLNKARNPERVLCITYRQTLSRDIMRNFGKLGFKS